MERAPAVPLIYRRRLVHHDAFAHLLEVRDHLAGNLSSRITLERAADLACMSPFHFQRMFARAFGETPHEFLTRLRHEEAKRLLRQGEPVTEVCLQVGYESLGSFSASFARREGCPPSEFRRIYSMPALWLLKSIPSCMRFGYGLQTASLEKQAALVLR